MRPLLVAAALLAGLNTQAAAQERVWRCGNEYTNDAARAKQRGCKLMEGGNVTVVQGARPSSPAAPAGSPRIADADQRARDGEARQVLEAELRKARERQARLLQDYNNGEPEKQGGEARNHQKYLDRVAEMQAEIARNESDIAGIRRELERLPAAR